MALAVIGNQMTFDASLTGPIAKDLRKRCERLSGFLGAQGGGNHGQPRKGVTAKAKA